MTMKQITEYLDDKMELNEKQIIITFYEVRVKMNLSEEDTAHFLKLCETRLNNLGYKVFYTGDKFVYNKEEKVVLSNQLMIAIKE